MKGLTPKQLAILHFIQIFIETHQYAPSYREIMEHFSFASPASVYKYICTLKRKGALVADKQSSRSLSPTTTPVSPSIQKEIELPFIGNVSAGYPIEMFVQSQTLTVPASLIHVPTNTYILRAQGDSLQDELIQDGDLLLVEARQEVFAGETILGLINQHDTTIKRYFIDPPYIRLESLHPNQQALTLKPEHIFIQGIIVGLIRTY